MLAKYGQPPVNAPTLPSKLPEHQRKDFIAGFKTGCAENGCFAQWESRFLERVD